MFHSENVFREAKVNNVGKLLHFIRLSEIDKMTLDKISICEISFEYDSRYFILSSVTNLSVLDGCLAWS